MTWKQMTTRWLEFGNQARGRLSQWRAKSPQLSAAERHQRIVQIQQERGVGFAQAEQDFESGANEQRGIEDTYAAKSASPSVELPKIEAGRWDDDGGTSPVPRVSAEKD
ncbi:hypothetical protein [Planctomicrobium piriforme]|uniref:Uncharacterized protein n=1 Tax=Planctomicrobium piriforme TaxID=1576369 RepID=A0A1I3PUB6_9PLAN|nr:hypothetical protein [Planctomicrobium piriforme]SFJ25163.1 hypothetical protein SAMN05421753_11743 [Planctomicrobium piriforme]